SGRSSAPGKEAPARNGGAPSTRPRGCLAGCRSQNNGRTEEGAPATAPRRVCAITGKLRTIISTHRGSAEAAHRLRRGTALCVLCYVAAAIIFPG
ncbi:unnamed protein product, partial [Amoebophrya sp. A120]